MSEQETIHVRPGQPRRLELLSVVVPILNEAETVTPFYERLRTALDGFTWELIAVDDGSTDGTLPLLRRIAERDARVRVVRLSRNFGHQAAMTAGLDHARGDAVVTIDADLQDPPEVIREMVAKWEVGADVVHGVRGERPGEPRWRMAAVSIFYRAFARLARIESVSNAGDFRLVDRRAVAALGSMRESNRFLRAMSVWIGFDQATVEYDRDPRAAGSTKYPFGKLVEFAFDAIVSFSFVPLRIAAILGFAVSAVAVVAFPVLIVLELGGAGISGIAILGAAVLLLGGIQLITIGIMGEYVGRSYEEAKHRPIYVVDEVINADREGGTEPGLSGLEELVATSSPRRFRR